jgi:thymidylate synthase
MKQYLELLKHVMDNGVDKPNRTDINARSLFGAQARYNLADGFPAVTTKKLAFNLVKAELLWFLKGSDNVKDLQDMGCHIWDLNSQADYWKPKARFEGDVGRIYGVQWRSWKSPYSSQPVDQLSTIIDRIKKDPHDRRLVVSAWNPAELDKMALPPCHVFFQFFVVQGKLSLQMYQRSCDMFLGVPFNIASYALLLHLVCKVTNLEPGEFIHTLGDVHIYSNHFEQVKTQLTRQPLALPQLRLNEKVTDINDFKMEDIELINYQHHEPIKAKMAV